MENSWIEANTGYYYSNDPKFGMLVNNRIALIGAIPLNVLVT